MKAKPWKKYRVKESQTGPIVWEAKRLRVTLKGSDDLPGMRPWLIVARNVLDGELKFFVSNAGEGVLTALLLSVAFQRWRVERCFEDQEREVGLDCFEGRRYLGLKRHLIITAISYPFLSRVCREEREKNPEWTIQRIRDATDAIVGTWYSPAGTRRAMLERVAARIDYHQRRNAAARESHTKTRIDRYTPLGIDPHRITPCRSPET